jgi:hypothetical protein
VLDHSQPRIIVATKRINFFDQLRIRSEPYTDDLPITVAIYNELALTIITAAGRNLKVRSVSFPVCDFSARFCYIASASALSPTPTTCPSPSPSITNSHSPSSPPPAGTLRYLIDWCVCRLCKWCGFPPPGARCAGFPPPCSLSSFASTPRGRSLALILAPLLCPVRPKSHVFGKAVSTCRNWAGVGRDPGEREAGVSQPGARGHHGAVPRPPQAQDPSRRCGRRCQDLQSSGKKRAAATVVVA